MYIYIYIYILAEPIVIPPLFRVITARTNCFLSPELVPFDLSRYRCTGSKFRFRVHGKNRKRKKKQNER